jgi:hypothetical protein
MKKLLVILLTLLMVMALPVAAMAADTTAEATTEATTEAAVETDENGVEILSPETEILEEEGPKTTFGFFPATLAETLPIMGMGMLGIFLVTCVIILAVLVLSKLGNKKEEE